MGIGSWGDEPGEPAEDRFDPFSGVTCPNATNTVAGVRNPQLAAQPRSRPSERRSSPEGTGERPSESCPRGRRDTASRRSPATRALCTADQPGRAEHDRAASDQK